MAKKKLKLMEKLDHLSDKEKAIVEHLLNILTKGEVEKTITVPKKRGRPPKKKIIVPASIPDEVPEPEPEDEIEKDVDESEDTDYVSPKPSTSGRAIPRNSANRNDDVGSSSAKLKQVLKNKGRPARTEPVRLKKQNDFLKMRERNSHQEDSKVDKILWKNKSPTERPEKYEPVEVQCTECKLYFDVNPDFIYVDPDEGVKFVCDNCASNHRN